MKINDLFKNKKDWQTQLAIEMLKSTFGDREINLDELEKLHPGIKKEILENKE